MAVGDDHDNAVAKAIGEELRRARNSVGWTRAQLAERMATDIHPQTLASYERGVRQCTIGRLVEICGTMGVSAPTLVKWGMQRAGLNLPLIGMEIDLRAVIRDHQEKLDPLRLWARGLLSEDPESEIARLDWSAVQGMAALYKIERSEFVEYLIMYTPRFTPRA